MGVSWISRKIRQDTIDHRADPPKNSTGHWHQTGRELGHPKYKPSIFYFFDKTIRAVILLLMTSQ
jgi:hypothetical protein